MIEKVDNRDQIQFRIELKTALMKAIIKEKNVRLYYRPANVKFDETNPTFLASLTEIYNFSIGDRIRLGDTKYGWLTEGFCTVPYTGSYIAPCHICGFFELQGHINSTKIKISDIFCALAVNIKDAPLILRTNGQKGPILLFWVEGLKLVHIPVQL